MTRAERAATGPGLRAPTPRTVNKRGEHILRSLREVAAERSIRSQDTCFAQRVAAVKHFQHKRFQRTYADLLADPRYGRAARFFLDDLYGPADFSARDDQFARVVPALVRLFPGELVETVSALGELHALSERLDSAMARHTSDGQLDEATYAAAWCVVGQPDERERQIALMLAVGLALDRYTRSALLRNSLRLMRGPALAAGLGALQRFLESGFDTFREMRGSDFFLDTVARREREIARRLFESGPPRLPTQVAGK